MKRLLTPLDAEQQARLLILIVMRWLLLAAAFFVADYRPGTTAADLTALNVVLAIAVLLNAHLHWLLWRQRPIALVLPLAASLYDLLAVTLGIAFVDGFDNSNFVLYYPALLAITLVFPGPLSLAYAGAAMLAYALIGVTTHDAFDVHDRTDVKAMVIRLISMAATIIIGNLVVRIDRPRRAQAVTAERAAGAERQRVAEEIHDGVSQNVYMLAMSLETLADVEARQAADPRRATQIQAMVQLAKETLIETRGLLTSLQPVMLGLRSLSEFLQNQAQEFTAITGIPVRVAVDGPPNPSRLTPPWISTGSSRRAWPMSTGTPTPPKPAFVWRMIQPPSPSRSPTTAWASTWPPPAPATA